MYGLLLQPQHPGFFERHAIEQVWIGNAIPKLGYEVDRFETLHREPFLLEVLHRSIPIGEAVLNEITSGRLIHRFKM